MSDKNGNGYTAQYSGGIPAPQISAPKTEAQAEKVLTALPMSLGYSATIPLMSYYGAGGVPVLSQQLWADCELMLTHPSVFQPLSYYKGGIANVAFEIKCKRSAAGEFLHNLYKRVWERSLTQIQRSYEYGWMAGEACYREEHGRLCYDSMLDFHPLDVYALTHRNKYAGVSVHNIQSEGSTGLAGGPASGALRLWGPGRFPAKGFWFAHNKRYQRFYGQSQLWAAWRPWRRLAFRDGLEEALDGGVYRYIYGGWEVYYPPEDFPKQDGGIDYTAGRNMARQFVEQAKAGAGIAIPNSRDEKGNRKWEFVRPNTVMNFDPALNIVKYLQDSISYGIGVPPELLQASETGSGWSGRKVPLIGFYAGQLGNARAIVAAIKVQLADPLLRWNFGPGIHHEVEVKLVLPPELAGEQPNKGTSAPTGGAVPQEPVTPGKDPAQTYAPAKEGATLGAATDEPFTLSVSDEAPSDDLANSAAERVLDEAMAAYARLSRRIKRELIAAVRAAPIGGGLAVARRVLGRWLPALTRALTDTQLSASLAGMREIAQRLRIEGERALPPGAKPDLEPWRPEPAAQVEEEASGRTAAIGAPAEAAQAPRLHLPLIDAAVADLRKRNLLTRDAFDALSAEARQQAFTVAGVESDNTLEAIRGALADAVEQGQTKEQFVRAVENTVDGQTFLSPNHAETVFRNSVNSAYSNAQQELLDHPLVVDLFPYAAYHAIADDRVRPEHLAMETRGIQGTNVYRRDDKVFQTFRPPWAWACRCGWTALSVRDAARLGIEEAIRWQATNQPPLHPAYVEMPPWRAPAAFQRPTELSTDAEGHEHKGKGPGGGQFTSNGGGGSASSSTAPKEKPKAARGEMVHVIREGKGKEARLVLADGSAAPAHIKAAKVPPAWTDVHVSLDPDADVQVQGKNKKGDTQTLYSDSWHMKAAAAKFARIHDALHEMPDMAAQVQRDRADPKKAGKADCTWLMMEQGTRPGSEADNKGVAELFGHVLKPEDVVLGDKDKAGIPKVSITVAGKTLPVKDDRARAELARRVEQNEPLLDSTFWLKSHGATTLEGRHVVQLKDGVHLQFMGKESVWHDHRIRDPKLAAMLLERKKAAGDRGKLFGVSDGQVSAYAKTLDGGGFSPKDWRTARGTTEAIRVLKEMEPPKAEKEYRKSVMAVAGKVSRLLGNRPAIALEKYISPTVFSGWRANLG